MMMSPDSSFGARSARCIDTPAGTISHTARGFESFFTKSSSEEEPMEPSLLSCFTESALRRRRRNCGRFSAGGAPIGAHSAQADHAKLHFVCSLSL